MIVGGGTITNTILWWNNPELMRRRSRFGEETKTWDKLILVVFGVLLSPMIAAAAMSLSSVSVLSNGLRLRSVEL